MNSRNILNNNTKKAVRYNKNSIGEDNKTNDMQVKQIKSKVSLEKLRSNFIFKEYLNILKNIKNLKL